jgi:hypothetical protein
MLNACTVITSDYLYKALALFDSMRTFRAIRMHVLIAEERRYLPSLSGFCFPRDGKLEFFTLDDIYTPKALAHLKGDKDRIRWTSKSIFMAYLLESKDRAPLIYLDSDIYFCSDFKFLFDELEDCAILLTPHWRPLDPGVNPDQFFCNFRDGLYNAGFIGATCQGLDALRWWHRACTYRCDFDFERGFYVDQRYLDAFPVYFQGVRVLRHLGCNIAQWNADYLERTQVDGEVRIHGTWPIVFIHFSGSTIDHIKNGNDPMLKPYFEGYTAAIQKARRYARACEPAFWPC